MLKSTATSAGASRCRRFSALQRAEIAEMRREKRVRFLPTRFSALQRAEIAEIFGQRFQKAFDAVVSVLFNEPKLLKSIVAVAFQRPSVVSVLFNEPKLLKSGGSRIQVINTTCFSALQRAEIAEIPPARSSLPPRRGFQCSSTSRNC